MHDIRVAVVGLGKRGVLAWIPALERLQGFRITAICDPIEALHDWARESLASPGDVKSCLNYDDVLADDNVDAVILTVRCPEQGAMAAQALEAGKHVNQEVPAAHTMDDCWRIVIAQEQSGLVYQSAEQMRYAGYVEAWRKLVDDETLGTVTYAEGQYLHYAPILFHRNPRTGRLVELEDLDKNPDAERTWFNDMPPMHYLVHDLSPILKVLDDRVVEVVGMSTESPSAAHLELTMPDIQAALMKTAKGALLRLAVSFTQPHPEGDCHWQQIIGTGGSVEWRRTVEDSPKLWLATDGATVDKRAMDWRIERGDMPAEANESSGHWGLDYFVHSSFRAAVLEGEPLEFDVYKAMDVAAAGILAAESIAQGSKPLRVPDFRPNALRPKGQWPEAQKASLE